MDKLNRLLDAFKDLGVRSASLSENLMHIEAASDDQLKLIARQLAVVPHANSRGPLHWLNITARVNGMVVLVMGPEHVTTGVV